MNVGDLVQKKWKYEVGTVLGIVVGIVFNGKIEYARVFWNNSTQSGAYPAEDLKLLK